MRTCAVDGCDNKHSAKGFCRKHYTRFIRYGNTAKRPHWKTKLREQDVIKIRALAENGMHRKEIEKLFNLSSTGAWQIINKETWKHLL